MMLFASTSSIRSNAVMVKFSTNQEKRYAHLSLAEREEIAVALEQGQSLRSIALSLGRSPSSVSREAKRNAPPLNKVKHRGNRAQRRAEDRSRRSHAKERLANPLVKAYVERHLIHDGWTPQGVAGRFSLDFPGLATNYESIYLWIYTEWRDLISCLARGHKKRHKRPSGKKSRVSKTLNRIDITKRPPQVEMRAQAGHWEVDTVVSRESTACAAVLVEWKTRFFMVIRMNDKTASAMNEAVTRALSGLPAGLRKTLAYDNGLENALHERTNTELGVRSYFCKPCHSWEKGSIENRNGILRSYFPKKHTWHLTTQEKIDKVVSKINVMPMKCLGYKTPAEVFAKCGGVVLAS
jgi:IS30 family transposase